MNGRIKTTGDFRRKPVKTENGGILHMGDFFGDESGMGTVEIILIIVVLIGLVIIFKKQLTTLVNNVFKKITQDSGTVMNG